MNPHRTRFATVGASILFSSALAFVPVYASLSVSVSYDFIVSLSSFETMRGLYRERSGAGILEDD